MTTWLRRVATVGTASAALSAPLTGETSPPSWQSLASLPDPVGYAGMAAGEMNGRLVAFGGSHFFEKPVWLNGTKIFSDRVFTLASPDAKWVEQPTRLPIKRGGFASTSGHDHIYVAGGLDSGGCSREVYRADLQGSEISLTRLEDLPTALGYPAATIVQERLYVVGGVSDPSAKSASTSVWSLDLRNHPEKGPWCREPDLPGVGVFVAAAATDGEGVYVLGGMSFDAAGHYRPSADVYRMKVGASSWETLPRMPEARVGPAVSPSLVQGRKLLVIGGYAAVFPGKPREHPGFNEEGFAFDLDTNTWTAGPRLAMPTSVELDAAGLPGPAPMIGAPSVIWKGLFVVVSGEVRPSVRTPAVVAWPLASPFTVGRTRTKP